MKKQIYFLFVVMGLVFIPFITVQAQYTIPSYNVELNQISATFEEDQVLNPLVHYEGNRAERKLNVDIKDNNPTQTASVTITVYSLDGLDVLGPFTVTEGTPFEVAIDDREWGVRVINHLQGAILSVWRE